MACNHETEDFVFDESTENYQMYDYYIDKYGNEGIVVYSGYYGEGYLLMVISADESYQSWGPMGMDLYPYDTITKNYINEPYFGIAMLQSMKSIGINAFHAQAWCDSKNKGDQHPYGGSWHLPTYRDIELCLKTESRINWINQALMDIGATPISVDSMYWTCVEDFPNYVVLNSDTNGVNFDPSNRAVATTPTLRFYVDRDRWLKQNKHHVRAIKYVYYKRKK